MELIALVFLILMVGVFVALTFNFFWILSVFLIYRLIGSIVTFEWAQETLGI